MKEAQSRGRGSGWRPGFCRDSAGPALRIGMHWCQRSVLVALGRPALSRRSAFGVRRPEWPHGGARAPLQAPSWQRPRPSRLVVYTWEPGQSPGSRPRPLCCRAEPGAPLGLVLRALRQPHSVTPCPPLGPPARPSRGLGAHLDLQGSARRAPASPWLWRGPGGRAADLAR